MDPIGGGGQGKVQRLTGSKQSVPPCSLTLWLLLPPIPARPTLAKAEVIGEVLLARGGDRK